MHRRSAVHRRRRRCTGDADVEKIGAPHRAASAMHRRDPPAPSTRSCQRIRADLPRGPFGDALLW
eukprot:1074947-Pyramimonas_sp.AAC.1